MKTTSVIFLIFLLVILAGLQIHWSGKVSRAERQRMMANLKTGVSQTADAFDREMSDMFMDFLSWRRNSREPGPHYSELVGHWRERSEFPEILASIHLVRFRQKKPILMELNESEQRFEPVEWPRYLDDTRIRLENLDESDHHRHKHGPSDLLDPSIPAIQVPVPPVNRGAHVRWPFIDRLVLTLNEDYIINQLMPELVQRYINPNGREDFAVSMYNENEELIYSSNQWQPSIGSGEVSERLFTITPIKRKLVEQSNPSRRVNRGRTRVPRFLEQAFSPKIKPLWLLEARHRSGSLENYLRHNQLMNLGLNFSILAILGVSIWLLARSEKRARRLATQQMEFVAGVSHELLTPLAGIRSASENLADGLVKEEERVRGYGGMIHSQVRRLTDMVEQVLAFAGMESQREIFNFQPLDLAETLEISINECRSQLDEVGFQVNKTIKPNLPTVSADREAMIQVFRNLIGNAVKYADTNPVLDLQIDVQKDWVVTTIADHGPGIAQPEIGEVFKPFYRGKHARDSQIKGSGMGLCLVDKILKAHKGSVSVRNRPEGGAIFTLQLPLAKP